MQGKQREATMICQICKKQKKTSDVMAGELVRAPIAEMIQKAYPD